MDGCMRNVVVDFKMIFQFVDDTTCHTTHCTPIEMNGELPELLPFATSKSL